MKRVLFIDRDGTLIIEPPDEQIDSFEKLDYYPGVFNGLGRIIREGDFILVMVTNQDGLGASKFPEDSFWPAHEKMLRTFEREGIYFADVFIDRSFASEKKDTRKPGTGMLTTYMSGGFDLANSFVIGDRVTDVELAKNLGSKGILLNDVLLKSTIDEQGLSSCCKLITTSWDEIATLVCSRHRQATVVRTTKETDIRVTLNLDGTGISSISTGLDFFDHMLDQLARHGQIDLEIKANGDLNIDEHHTIEDTALALGDAVLKALGDKRGIGRYGFCLPMDDCLAQVALDFGGRPWLVWEAEFKRERIGEMPTEMFLHFFKSFSDAGRCNLNIKAEGQNEHHKIESIFKAFAKAIRQAIKKEGNMLPTTKGTL